MLHKTSALQIALLSLSLAAVGINCNGGGQPDLVPERQPGADGPQGFCRRSDQGLTVRVRNQSNQDVLSQSATVVVFSPGGPRTATTPPLAAGSFADVTVQIPSGCFNSDCDFTITVDSNDTVSESNEANNMEDGICIG